jgi:hypothetical protein
MVCLHLGRSSKQMACDGSCIWHVNQCVGTGVAVEFHLWQWFPLIRSMPPWHRAWLPGQFSFRCDNQLKQGVSAAPHRKLGASSVATPNPAASSLLAAVSTDGVPAWKCPRCFVEGRSLCTDFAQPAKGAHNRPGHWSA